MVLKPVQVAIREEQFKYFKDNCINMSAFLRKRMDEYIEKVRQEKEEFEQLRKLHNHK